MGYAVRVKLPPLPSSVPAARAPAWSDAPRAHRACPVCGADAPEPLCQRPDDLPVARCACGMLYLPDVFDEATLRALYEHYAGFKGYARAGWLRRRLDALRDVRIKILEETGGLRGRRLLEVGASQGTFLERARWHGAGVAAVELDVDARAHLERLGIAATAEVPPDARADVVCAFQVLEHLPDPGALVAAIARALADDGRLLVEIPNGGEVERVGATWVGFRVDLEHLNYFSLRTMSDLLARHGLYVEQHWLTAQPGIQRANGAASPSLSARLRDVAARAASRLFEAGRVARQGTYVLTVLARKTSPDSRGRG
jgi:SAM-dependent methyltransferase